jgi:hypothetical protein
LSLLATSLWKMVRSTNRPSLWEQMEGTKTCTVDDKYWQIRAKP